MINLILIASIGAGSPSDIKRENGDNTILAWTTIFSENFETVTPPALPDGWTAIDGNGDNDTWQTYQEDCAMGLVYMDPISQFACYDDIFASFDTLEILRTPKIAIPNGANNDTTRIRFDWACFSAGEALEGRLKIVYWSGSGSPDSTTITVLTGFDCIVQNVQGSDTIDFTGFLTGNADTVYFEFIWYDPGDVAYGLGIDNIVVETRASDLKETPNSNAYLFKSKFIKDGKIEFINPIDKDTRLKIYSLDGSLVRDIKLIEGTKIVNVGKLNSGMYIYIIENRRGKIFVK